MSFPPPLPERAARAALAVYTALLLAGTLWPFDPTLDPDALSRHWAEVEWVPFTQVCPDCGWDLSGKALNVAMTIPFGFLLSFLNRRSGPLSALLVPAAGGFLLSLAIESTQVFLPRRTPQASDLVENAAGALLGGAAMLLLLRPRKSSTSSGSLI